MIGVFKTNITTSAERQELLSALTASFKVGRCHVDLEDCDRVLRVPDMQVTENLIIDFVKARGFHCEILE